MLFNDDGSIARDIAGYFLLSLFINKTSEATHIDVVPGGHIALNNIEERFYGGGNICFVDSGLVSNLVDYVSFCHRVWF